MPDGRHSVRAGLPPIANDVTDASYCFPQPAVAPALPIRLLCAGREQCLPTYHVSRSDYPCMVMEFVHSGEGRLRIGETTYELRAGVFFCYGMNAPHDLWSDQTSPMNKYFAIFTCEDQRLFQKSPAIQPGQVRCSLDIDRVRQLFDHMIDEGRGTGEAQGVLCNHYLQLLLLKSAIAPSLDPDESNASGGLNSYQRAYDYIESNYTEIASLAELAEAVELSPAYLCRLFRRFARETPHQCIVRHKLNRAAELLMSHETSVGNVAAAVGYTDIFHFSRLFKKRFGDSPRNFRKGLGAPELAKAKKPAPV